MDRSSLLLETFLFGFGNGCDSIGMSSWPDQLDLLATALLAYFGGCNVAMLMPAIYF